MHANPRVYRSTYAFRLRCAAWPKCGFVAGAFQARSHTGRGRFQHVAGTGESTGGDDSHEVIASADGTRAYVSNYGFGAFHTLAVVDLVAHQAMPSIDLGALRGPHGLTFQGGKTWFTAEAAKGLGRYDPATGKIDLILGTGQNRTHMIWISADGQEIVTTNVSSGTVSIFTQEPVRMPSPPSGAQPPGGAGSRPPGPPPGAPPMPRTDWNETVIHVGNGSEGF